MTFLVNILILQGLSLGALGFWCWRIRDRRAIFISPALRYFTAGMVMLALPLAYTTDVRVPGAAWRVAGAVLGILWFFSCLQLRWRRCTLLTVLYGVLLLVGMQAIIAGQQWLMPDNAWVPLYGHRIYGTFFQPNVLASFIATGVTLILALLLLPGLASKHAGIERARQYSLNALLVVLSALLICIQSRAGWLGGLAAVLLLFRFGRITAPNTVNAVAALTGGVALGSAWLLSGEALLPLTDHSGSNMARWTMLRDTLAMIAERPLLGWGYGGFEYDFQHFRVNQSPPTPVTEIARHPHNEILLWAVEGGVVGLVGVLLMVAGAGIIVRQAIKRDRLALRAGHRMAGVATALSIALLPMAIHSLLEFPFYLSTLHFVIFLLLLAMADSLGTTTSTLPTLADRASQRLNLAMTALTLGIAALAMVTIEGEVTLTQVETFGMEDVTPLTTLSSPARHLLLERITFDEQVGALMTYNRTRDEQLLEGYSRWAQTYLQHRIDKHVYANLITILRHQKHPATAEHYRREAALLFPTDRRFASSVDTPAPQHYQDWP
ncbi:Lipid A core - O-antigen ligase and related enzymes [Serratia fonticola]|uniref:Lipid A core - O-antigen ligase and related enzymes n=1 Tax=Serratia fonticola TaxID=47917 RepID=A0A4U9VYL7_SERFO|nr:Wzy polymerase domain-containing protein [Serratia fonticola]CAI1530965.1 Lipid A core - O-antigen ligase and related enzymes [Serratia fonticola]VTR51667.1 Lipid A core - O-antigen ligase and related enzymes [Serratia fonticola]